jgi:NADP-dependent aldehyde dehydrogenase
VLGRSNAAQGALADYRQLSPERAGEFLDRIADGSSGAGELLEVANAESALPHERLAGESSATAGTAPVFGNWFARGSWVDARIDRAVPDRKPLPKRTSAAC